MFVVLAFVRVLIFMCKSVAFCMYTCVVFHKMRVAFCVRACIAFYAYMRMWLLCIYAFSFCVWMQVSLLLYVLFACIREWLFVYEHVLLMQLYVCSFIYPIFF